MWWSMDKLELVKYDHDKLNINKLYSTEYDDLFKPQIRSRGIAYYNDGKISDFQKKDNVITAVISGGKDYKVSIEILKSKKIDVKCNCLYHKDTDIYCKHVYSLLIKNKVDDEKTSFIKAYESNKDRLLETMDLIERLLNENKKYFYDYQLSFGLKLRNHYEKYIKEMNDKYDINNFYKLVSVVNDSFFHLNNSINDYNELIDMIEENKKECERREKLEQEEIKKQELVNKVSNKQHSKSKTKKEPLFELLDNYIASMPHEVLDKVREDSLAKNEDTEIIDRAIQIKLKHSVKYLKLKELRKLLKLDKKESERKIIKKAITWKIIKTTFKVLLCIIGIIIFIPFVIIYLVLSWCSKTSKKTSRGFGLLSLLLMGDSGKKESSGNLDAWGLEDWQEDLVRSGQYEPWNFEEENLEEDDYYYEDLD